METTKNNTRKVRVPGIDKGRKSGLPGMSQHRSGKTDEGFSGLPESNRLQFTKSVYSPDSTGSLNLTGLTFKTKMGFDIIKNYGVPVDFSCKEKVNAYMLYTCLRYLPGFEEKQFDDVNEAVKHVYHEYARLVKFPSGFIANYSYKDKAGIPNHYLFQICYDEFHADQGRWQSYDEMLKNTDHDKELQKAVIMCMRIIIYDFQFTLFDGHGGEYVQDMDDWSNSTLECIQSELECAYEQFEEENKRKFNPDTDKDHLSASGIIQLLNDIDAVDLALNVYNEQIVPLNHRIANIKVNLKHIKKVSEKYKGEDIGDWLNHILIMKKKKFSITNYVADSYRTMDGSIIDEESLSPLSAYGYIYDGDGAYANGIQKDYQSYAENYCIVPFVLNKIIDPQLGILYETENVPIGAWINKIFSFSFINLKYEYEF